MYRLNFVSLFLLCFVLSTTDSQKNECLNKPGGRCISTQLPCGPNSTHSGYCCGSTQCCIDCNKDIECLAKTKGRCGSACDQGNKEIQEGTCCGEQQVCCKFSPCASNPCLFDGTCNAVGETVTDFVCLCVVPYYGRNCEKIMVLPTASG